MKAANDACTGRRAVELFSVPKKAGFEPLNFDLYLRV
jgi:hypothetical protein